LPDLPLPDLALPDLAPLDRGAEPALRARLDAQARPPGSLGRLEDLAVQIALIQRTDAPRTKRARVLVFAGDHGLNEEGVSAYPSAVTGAMVGLFLGGRASIDAIAGAVGCEVRVVDAGVASDLPPHPALTDARVRAGTRNAAREPAMTPHEARLALARGVAIARAAADEGVDAIGLGEMGIGATASAALLMHRLAPAPLEDCIGSGAGHDAEGLARKRAALARAAARSPATEPFEVLCEFGGLEIAMMAGAAVGAAAAERVVVVDGFIAGAAVLVAARLRPAVLERCVFAHRSAERGHALMLEALGVEPLLDLRLRLGEGTGAALAMPLLRAACAVMREVAPLAEVLGPPRV